MAANVLSEFLRLWYISLTKAQVNYNNKLHQYGVRPQGFIVRGTALSMFHIKRFSCFGDVYLTTLLHVMQLNPQILLVL